MTLVQFRTVGGEVGGWMATVSEMVVQSKLQSRSKPQLLGTGAWRARDKVTASSSGSGACAESSTARRLQFLPEYLSTCPSFSQTSFEIAATVRDKPTERWRRARRTSTIFIVMEGTSRWSLICIVTRSATHLVHFC